MTDTCHYISLYNAFDRQSIELDIVIRYSLYFCKVLNWKFWFRFIKMEIKDKLCTFRNHFPPLIVRFTLVLVKYLSIVVDSNWFCLLVCIWHWIYKFIGSRSKVILSFLLTIYYQVIEIRSINGIYIYSLSNSNDHVGCGWISIMSSLQTRHHLDIWTNNALFRSSLNFVWINKMSLMRIFKQHIVTCTFMSMTTQIYPLNVPIK